MTNALFLQPNNLFCVDCIRTVRVDVGELAGAESVKR